MRETSVSLTISTTTKKKTEKETEEKRDGGGDGDEGARDGRAAVELDSRGAPLRSSSSSGRQEKINRSLTFLLFHSVFIGQSQLLVSTAEGNGVHSLLG